MVNHWSTFHLVSILYESSVQRMKNHSDQQIAGKLKNPSGMPDRREQNKEVLFVRLFKEALLLHALLIAALDVLVCHDGFTVLKLWVRLAVILIGSNIFEDVIEVFL